ncbi:MAG: hypothetical protein AB7L66_06235 [Gemmatimonadales bacterium]
MTQCETLSERMPVLARGAEWTAAEREHLAACGHCAAEWRLLSAAASLGGGIQIDAERVAGAVRARLAADPRPTRSLWVRRAAWVTGLAAAAALFVAIRTAVRTEAVVAASPMVLSELDQLSEQELETLLDDWSDETAKPSAAVSGMGDLTADELERLLSGWEGS